MSGQCDRHHQLWVIDILDAAFARELELNSKVVIAVNTAWNLFNFRSGLIRALIEEGYEVVVVAPYDDYAPRLETLGCRYVPLPMDNQGTSPLNDLLLLWRFWRLMRYERPDAFLGYTVKPNVYGSIAAKVLGIPVINNVAGLGVVFTRGGWLNWVVKALYRQALSHSQRVFFQNDDDRSLFLHEGLVRSDQAGLLPGSGVDLQRYVPVALHEELLDESLSVNDPVDTGHIQGTFSFLLVARLLWNKGVGEFVEAARLVQKRVPNVNFKLLGFVDVQNPAAIDRSTIDDWVSEGVVEYLGATDDVRPFLSASDCVVLPSYYMEGTPKCLLEAAAMARPIITTDWVGCRNVVDEGINGFLCNVRDPEDLADKMLTMVRLSPTKRAAMGAAGRAKVEREFDEKIVIKSYLKALAAIESQSVKQ